MTQGNKTFWHGRSVPSGSQAILVQKASAIEFDGNLGFLSFDAKIGEQVAKNYNALSPADLSNKKMTMLVGLLQMPGSVVSHVHAEKIADGPDGSGVCHFDSERENVGGCSLPPTRLSSLDSDTTLPVDKAGEVGKLFIPSHGKPPFVNTPIMGRTNGKGKLLAKKLANSENPLTSNVEGNPEPSRKDSLPGVCREYGLTPKGMMYSGLHGNMQSVAEMTTPPEMGVTFARKPGCSRGAGVVLW